MLGWEVIRFNAQTKGCKRHHLLLIKNFPYFTVWAEPLSLLRAARTHHEPSERQAMVLPCHTSSSAVRDWAGSGATSDLQPDAEGQQAGPSGDDGAPQWHHDWKRVVQNRLLSCTESSSRGFVKGHMGDTGTTMPPAPSLPARPP